MPALDPKTRISTLGILIREKLHLNSAHTELHQAIYVLCLPPLLIALNGLLYYSVHGEARWPDQRGAVWAADTFAAPWFSLIANLVATVLFVVFVRHKRVRSSSKIITAAVLSSAWLCTLIGFLVVA